MGIIITFYELSFDCKKKTTIVSFQISINL